MTSFVNICNWLAIKFISGNIILQRYRDIEKRHKIFEFILGVNNIKVSFAIIAGRNNLFGDFSFSNSHHDKRRCVAGLVFFQPNMSRNNIMKLTIRCDSVEQGRGLRAHSYEFIIPTTLNTNFSYNLFVMRNNRQPFNVSQPHSG